MNFRNKRVTPAIEGAVSRAVDFEITISDIARRSERRAWIVACSSLAMSLILAGGYFYLLPLKEKVPYLVMADPYSGTSTVARLVADSSNRSISTSEAINRSNIAHFILARESYDINMMRLRDWKTVYTMASPEVAVGYTNLHSNNNPDSPFNIYGRNQAIRVRILSTTLIGGSKDAAPKGATVRFQRSLYEKSTGASQPLDSKIATLEFSYNPNLGMSDEDRIENPLGFRVASYRVDNDYAASPPLEAEVSQAPAAALQASGSELAAPAQSAPAAEVLSSQPGASGPAPTVDLADRYSAVGGADVR